MRLTPAARCCCSPTSTTSTTTAARRTSRATRSCSRDTTRSSPGSRTPAFEDLQTTSLESLREARHSQQPIFPLEGHAIDLPEGVELSRDDLLAHAPQAIERAASQMLEPPLGDFEGLPALRRFAAEVGDWPEAAEDWQWCARFLYQVIERRGTGGGNFRKMYSRFLEEAGYEESALAQEAADDWSALAIAARSRERAGRGRSGALASALGRGGEGARRRGAPLGRALRARLI